MNALINLDTIAHHMCIAAAWADAPEGTSPRVTKSALAKARDFAERFTTRYPDLTLSALNNEDYGWYNGTRNACAAFGNDLYLTAVGHGVGFWDRDALDADGIGDALSEPLNQTR